MKNIILALALVAGTSAMAADKAADHGTAAPAANEAAAPATDAAAAPAGDMKMDKKAAAMEHKKCMKEAGKDKEKIKACNEAHKM